MRVCGEGLGEACADGVGVCARHAQDRFENRAALLDLLAMAVGAAVRAVNLEALLRQARPRQRVSDR